MVKKVFNITLILAFLGVSLNLPSTQAGEIVPLLPKPGAMVFLSDAFNLAQLQGMTIDPKDPLAFDFLINTGDSHLDPGQKKEEYKKLVKYFLAALTVADDHQWVNLSPYEKDRMIEPDFGKTDMGHDLLAQDYILKQITSSLMYPEGGLGKEFWNNLYAQAYKEFKNTNIPVDTFNKVWIVPDEAVVYERANAVYILKSHLKVMLEEDYLALDKNQRLPGKTHSIASQVIRDIILPAIEKEVNEGKNFAPLRQIVSGMILATWYKKSLKESLLGKIYADKAKLEGINQDSKNNEMIYRQYLAAFKKGVYNYIKEDLDTYTHQIIPRRYFAGGFKSNPAMLTVLSDANFFGPTSSLMESLGNLGPGTLDRARFELEPIQSNNRKTVDAAMIEARLAEMGARDVYTLSDLRDDFRGDPDKGRGPYLEFLRNTLGLNGESDEEVQLLGDSLEYTDGKFVMGTPQMAPVPVEPALAEEGKPLNGTPVPVVPAGEQDLELSNKMKMPRAMVEAALAFEAKVVMDINNKNIDDRINLIGGFSSGETKDIIQNNITRLIGILNLYHSLMPAALSFDAIIKVALNSIVCVNTDNGPQLRMVFPLTRVSYVPYKKVRASGYLDRVDLGRLPMMDGTQIYNYLWGIEQIILQEYVHEVRATRSMIEKPLVMAVWDNQGISFDAPGAWDLTVQGIFLQGQPVLEEEVNDDRGYEEIAWDLAASQKVLFRVANYTSQRVIMRKQEEEVFNTRQLSKPKVRALMEWRHYYEMQGKRIVYVLTLNNLQSFINRRLFKAAQFVVAMNQTDESTGPMIIHRGTIVEEVDLEQLRYIVRDYLDSAESPFKKVTFEQIRPLLKAFRRHNGSIVIELNVPPFISNLIPSTRNNPMEPIQENGGVKPALIIEEDSSIEGMTAVYLAVTKGDDRVLEWPDIRPMILTANFRNINMRALADFLFNNKRIDGNMRKAIPMLANIERYASQEKQFDLQSNIAEDNDEIFRWFNGLEIGMDKKEQEMAARIISKLHPGAYKILYFMDVLTEREVQVFTDARFQRKTRSTIYKELRALPNHGRDMGDRIKRIYDEYHDREKVSLTNQQTLQHRLIPVPVIDILSDYYGIAKTYMMVAVDGHQNFITWIPQALALVQEITRTVKTRSNAMRIVWVHGLNETIPWLREVMVEVGRVSSEIGENNAWLFIAYHGKGLEVYVDQHRQEFEQLSHQNQRRSRDAIWYDIIKSRVDAAMPGGIDLNPKNLHMQRLGGGMTPLTTQGLERFYSDVDGFLPVFIRITPEATQPILSELKSKIKQEQPTAIDS